jgi:hypothetical protein
LAPLAAFASLLEAAASMTIESASPEDMVL